MNHVRNNIKKDFTQIPNSLINDNELSDRARFLFCYMASKPDDWKFYQEKLASDLRMSVDTLRKYLSELLGAGWITRELVRGEKGVFDSFDYELHSQPCRKNTDTVKNGVGKLPSRKNSALNNKDYIITKTINNKEGEPAQIKVFDQVEDVQVVVVDSIEPIQPIATNPEPKQRKQKPRQNPLDKKEVLNAFFSKLQEQHRLHPLQVCDVWNWACSESESFLSHYLQPGSRILSSIPLAVAGWVNRSKAKGLYSRKCGVQYPVMKKSTAPTPTAPIERPQGKPVETSQAENEEFDRAFLEMCNAKTARG